MQSFEQAEKYQQPREFYLALVVAVIFFSLHICVFICVRSVFVRVIIKTHQTTPNQQKNIKKKIHKH